MRNVAAVSRTTPHLLEMRIIGSSSFPGKGAPETDVMRWVDRKSKEEPEGKPMAKEPGGTSLSRAKVHRSSRLVFWLFLGLHVNPSLLLMFQTFSRDPPGPFRRYGNHVWRGTQS